jgi:hypothetical protein
METRVLNPHEVPKCSQLYLVLVQFKANDLKQFCQNLRVSPRTFDAAGILCQTHTELEIMCVVPFLFHVSLASNQAVSVA